MNAISAAIAWLQLHAIMGMLIVFSMIVVTTYWPGRRASLERNGSIPLLDDRSSPHDDR